MKLNSFFTYFGSKVRDAKYYPEPRNGTIIEPFAGAAGYSLMYAERDIILNDADPVIAGIWDYLIKTSAEEIMRLPLDRNYGPDIPMEAKWLIGFWLERGRTKPAIKESSWMKTNKWPNSFWGEHIRQRIASQVDKIRHWKIYNRQFDDLPPFFGTYFIDPPYQKQGKAYSVKFTEYDKLSDFIKERELQNQVIVCEQEGANWLPFRPLKECKNSKRQNKMEVIYP